MFSIPLNGSPTGFFKSTNGVRQGDPLSPYLFTIAMEGFTCLIDEAVRSEAIKVPTAGTIQVSHITFADDLIVFIKNDLPSIQKVANVLQKFSDFSGLRLNNVKSKLYIGAGITNKDVIFRILNVSEGTLPIPYLGLPLFSTSIEKSHCLPLLDKIKRRSNSWKNKLLL